MVQKTSWNKSGLLEAATNSIGGYPVGFIMGIVILPLSINWIQKDPIVANLTITMLYVCVSFVRTYLLRRVFIKYNIDDNFLRLGIRTIKKIRMAKALS
jgi:hypothetical protein